MPDLLAPVRTTLQRHGQDHLLAFDEQLDESGRHRLLEQIRSIDFDELDRLIELHVRSAEEHPLPTDLEPAPYYANDASDYDAAHYRAAGEALIRAGKVAAFLVAGGQGTRLGWAGPKGTFPGTPVTGKPLFRVFAEQIQAVRNRYRVDVPWYIMTSEANDADTRAFFADNNWFGLDQRDIFIFPQGMMPSLCAKTGRILLAGRDRLAMNPDGHGGSIRALRASGAVEDMKARGVEHISYFQVDNPLVNVVDPLFLGLHAAAPDSSGEMSSKMVAKAYPGEKVGVFCRSEGKTMVVEYSDLPEELAQATDDKGGLRFNAGSIAIHILGVSFVEQLTADPSKFGLPFHRAVKKAPHIDLDTGELIEPEEPNAVKLETFVFDALPLAERSIVYETSRAEEFAPIKNADGVDSPATSHRLQSDRAGRWMEHAGATVPKNDTATHPTSKLAEGAAVADPDAAPIYNATLEVSPLTALEADDLAGHPDLPDAVAPGQAVAI